MITLEFDPSAIADMRHLYTEELHKTLSRLQHIKTVLDTVGGTGAEIHISIKPNPANGQAEQRSEVATGNSHAQPGEPPMRSAAPLPAQSPPEPSEVKPLIRRGRKPVWEAIIMKRLRQLDKPVTYAQLTNEIMLLDKIEEKDREKTKSAIQAVIFRLRNGDKKVKTISLGQREKFVVLPGWTTKQGVLLARYKKRAELS